MPASLSSALVDSDMMSRLSPMHASVEKFPGRQRGLEREETDTFFMINLPGLPYVD